MKVLIAEDDLLTRKILEKYLQELDYEVTCAADGQQAWQLLQQEHFSLLLTDWMMPHLTGPELVKLLRQREEELYTYVILLTAKGKKDEVVQGLEQGADDYIVKPFEKEELTVRLRAGQRIIELQQKLLDANRELQRLAEIDPLTGLFNRRALMDRLQQACSSPPDPAKQACAILADIDFFKRVNDTLGHDAGDQVLIGVAGCLQKVFSSRAIVARIGGEEFVILLPQCQVNEARELAERARALIEDSTFFFDSGESSVTCSFGLYCLPAGECTPVTFEQCMKIADNALYQSKTSGRNKVTLHCKEGEDTPPC